jgi:hypothetical protein
MFFDKRIKKFTINFPHFPRFWLSGFRVFDLESSLNLTRIYKTSRADP